MTDAPAPDATMLLREDVEAARQAFPNFDAFQHLCNTAAAYHDLARRLEEAEHRITRLADLNDKAINQSYLANKRAEEAEQALKNERDMHERHVERLDYHSARADQAEAALAAARAEGAEAMRADAANVVRANQERFTETGGTTSRGLSPRFHGNLSGLAYAEAIEALPLPSTAAKPGSGSGW